MATKTKEGQARETAKKAEKRAEEKREEQERKLEAHIRSMAWKNEKTKARAWAFIVYPESAPENWRDILQKTGLEIAISPLHNCDKDPTEEDKKPHWHIIALWANVTTGSAVKRITESVNAPTPIPLNGVKGYYRYFTHKDNPEKFQYDEREIQIINGFCIEDLVELKKSEVNEVKKRLMNYIEENNITEYYELMICLMHEDYTTEFDVAGSHTYYFDKYISSRRNMQREGKMPGDIPANINPVTGEVLE